MTPLEAFAWAARAAYWRGVQFPGQEGDSGQLRFFAAAVAGVGPPRSFACPGWAVWLRGCYAR